jgi:predicted RecB family nuclease
LEGLTEKADETLKHIGIKTISDLASSKYFKWAEAIVEVAKYEEQLTAKQRRVAREQEKLADFNDK